MKDERESPTADFDRRDARRQIEDWARANRHEPLTGLPSDWPLAIWHVLVEEYPDYRFWAAHQVHCPAPIVRRLAIDPDWRVRLRVAQKRNLPADLFPVFAADPDDSIRKAIAAHPKAPTALVEALAEDGEREVSRLARDNLEVRLAQVRRRAALKGKE